MSYDRCGERELANELAQETFLCAFRGMDKLRDPAKFLPWLIQISRNLAMDSLRDRVRQRRVLEVARDHAKAFERQPAADKLENEELLTAVRSLPEPDRTAIRLFYLCDQPADQARRILGLSRSGFYKALDRAKQSLRQQLDPVPGAKA